MWTATTPQAAFFQIAEHCNREQFDALIGPYTGIVVSDRWNGYSHLDPNQRQVCWSHLQHDFRRHADGLAEQKTFGEQGLELTRRVFAAWRAYQHEHPNRAQLTAEIAPIQTELQRLLQDASPKNKRTRWHRRFANNLVRHPVSSTCTASWSSTRSCRCRCGPASKAEARWQIASTLPVESVTPNRSRASSEIPRREIRYPAVNVTTAACNLGPNAEAATCGGNDAVVRSRHWRQRSWCVRCSTTSTLIGGRELVRESCRA